MFNWLKKLIKKNNVEWKYQCSNDHKWSSSESPRGTYLYGIEGQTRCRICKSILLIGKKYENGKFMGGAVHEGFRWRRKK